MRMEPWIVTDRDMRESEKHEGEALAELVMRAGGGLRQPHRLPRRETGPRHGRGVCSTDYGASKAASGPRESGCTIG
jgi:hypothetical protein